MYLPDPSFKTDSLIMINGFEDLIILFVISILPSTIFFIKLVELSKTLYG